ncbi:MAG: ATP-binding protein [Eubacteriales bacterium]|nr:ATP-binding protein [Eubacteriales bacterium]
MKKNNSIIGRNEECERLSRCLRSNSAQLVVVYGRRRVGKTYLINEFFENTFAFKLTGVYGQKRKEQLQNFTAELNRRSEKKYTIPKDWIEAFNYLREYMDGLDANNKQVVFLDELPWLDGKKSGFLSAFEYFWNDYASTKHNFIFVLCGSATSWMDEKITKNKGGLFNRQTCRLYLEPFSLHEVEEFLTSKEIYWSKYEIAECYMIMGGIPYYLNLLDSEESLHQNIDRLFFKKKGELWDEFEHLYNTLFTNSEYYVAVVEALSEKKGGLTRGEICDRVGISKGGDISKILKNLSLSGFVVVCDFYGRKKKESLYQLSDYFTLFYFKYIRGHYGKDEHFWSNSVDNASRKAWEGLTFERICKDHIKQIKSKLGISGVLSEEASWFVKSDDEKCITGAQIDLLIDRRDYVVSLCEMKYSLSEFDIDKAYDANLRNKISTFTKVTSCKKTIQLVMITTFGVKRNKYSGLVGTQVLLDDLFCE